MLVCDFRSLHDYHVQATEDVLLQSEDLVSILSHSVGLGFSQTVALKPKSRLTAHHYDSGGNRITLAHLSVTNTLHGLASSVTAEDLF